ncbi:lytic murein transglycosylase B [Vreelandella gomseomensis]|uniref:Lytic murein transglycosylase B n=1 Tax=Vreelandella gomseomensis TaxID=370766 RepID=A0ABU1GAQ8_9GAMM|nr:lytic murein transglycosylase B [Halomonas gomseomensis]MDR5874570.1 lytic murein transglycosylase B [Halomonas gomseomensis]
MSKAIRMAGVGILGALIGSLTLPLMAEEGSGVFNPDDYPQAQRLVKGLEAKGVPAEWANHQLRQAKLRQSVLDAMAGAAERHLAWHEYRDIFITDQRIEEGVAFQQAHDDALAKAEAVYGVPRDIITAIIGVETYYGRYRGSHPVLDSLATLAFEHPTRGEFFTRELAAFLQIAHEQQVDPATLSGSYAGAMGYPQFIPTSYQAYAVDFDDDGLRDLWNNPVDAIGSVANYFAEHGWQEDGAIYYSAEGPASAPEGLAVNQITPPGTSLNTLKKAGITPGMSLEEGVAVSPLVLTQDDGTLSYRLGLHNFYVITRYNHSHLYAMAVTELAEAIGDATSQAQGESDL